VAMLQGPCAHFVSSNGSPAFASGRFAEPAFGRYYPCLQQMFVAPLTEPYRQTAQPSNVALKPTALALEAASSLRSPPPVMERRGLTPAR
jgi:hypothetical protein